jgi:hypothetical protein
VKVTDCPVVDPPAGTAVRVVVVEACATVTVVVPDEVGQFVVPGNVAVTVSLPTGRAEVDSVAVPLEIVPEPSDVEPLAKFTGPEGVQVAGTLVVTVAVSPTLCPKTLDVGAATTEVDVVGVGGALPSPGLPPRSLPFDWTKKGCDQTWGEVKSPWLSPMKRMHSVAAVVPHAGPLLPSPRRTLSGNA